MKERKKWWTVVLGTVVKHPERSTSIETYTVQQYGTKAEALVKAEEQRAEEYGIDMND